MTPLAALLLCATWASAGPWVRSPGATWLQLGTTSFRSEQVPGALPYASDAVRLYGEVGLPGRFQVVAAVPFTQARHTAEGPPTTVYRNRGAGDLSLGLDRQLHTGTAHLALGLELRTPLYPAMDTHTEADGLDPELVPALLASFPELGEHVTDLTARLAAGWGLPGGWVTAGGGPRLRFGAASGVAVALGGGWWAVPEVVAFGCWTEGSLSAWWSALPRQDSLTALAQVHLRARTRLRGWGLSAHGGGVPWTWGGRRGASFGVAVTHAHTPRAQEPP